MRYSALPTHRSPHLLLVLFSAAGLLGSPALHAQQATPPIRLSPEDRDRGQNGVQKNFYFSTKDTPTDDDYQNAGYFGQRLRPYMAAKPEALASLNRYRRQKWLFLGERLVFVGAVGTYGAQVLSGENPHYFDNAQKVTLGVVAVSLLSNIFITRHTNEHFERAVNAYNAGLSADSRTGSFFRRLTPSAVGLAAAPTGQPQLAFRWQLR